MPPIWILWGLLGLVGAFATVKVVQAVASPSCLSPKTIVPPVNGFFKQGEVGIDYAKLGEDLRSAATKKGLKEDAEIAGAAATLGAAAATTGIGAPVAAAIVAIGGAIVGAKHVLKWIAGDPNSKEEQAKLENAQRAWIDRYYIPPIATQDDTLKALRENLEDALTHIDTGLDPYLRWFCAAVGYQFKRWGGQPEVRTIGLRFVIGDAVTFGTIPNGGDTTLTHNQPRLLLFATCVAFDYGIPEAAPQIYDAALSASQNWESYLPWKPLNDEETLGQMRPLLAFVVGCYAAFEKAAALVCVAPPPDLKVSGNAGVVPADSSPFIQRTPLGSSAPTAPKVATAGCSSCEIETLEPAPSLLDQLGRDRPIVPR